MGGGSGVEKEEKEREGVKKGEGEQGREKESLITERKSKKKKST